MCSANGSFSYRNWFPSEEEAPIRELVVHSINELDAIARKTDNAIGLNRNGYLFVTREPAKLAEFQRLAKKLEQNGGGALRVHKNAQLDGYAFPSPAMAYDLDGCDLLMGLDTVQKVFPALKDSSAVGALHVRRCGSMNPFKLVRGQRD